MIELCEGIRNFRQERPGMRILRARFMRISLATLHTARKDFRVVLRMLLPGGGLHFLISFIPARYVDDNDLVETLLSGSAVASHTMAIKVHPAAAHISCHNALLNSNAKDWKLVVR